jgi:hypothetical protein
MVDQDLPGSQYGAVYAALSASLDAGMCNVAPGTESAVARALVYFRTVRDEAAVARLERIALNILGLQQALRGRSAAEYRRRRRALLRQTRAWLDRAPLFAGDAARAH